MVFPRIVTGEIGGRDIGDCLSVDANYLNLISDGTLGLMRNLINTFLLSNSSSEMGFLAMSELYFTKQFPPLAASSTADFGCHKNLFSYQPISAKRNIRSRSNRHHPIQAANLTLLP